MLRVTSLDGATVSYDAYGAGPALVLVHGGFSDHRTNWEFVKPLLAKQFAVYAIARRGRGETDATVGHNLEEESRDVLAVIRAIGEPVYLLGHSYGAQTALAAAAQAAGSVRKLVLYEPPWPRAIGKDTLARLEPLAQAGRWDDFAVRFFRDTLSVPAEELNALVGTESPPDLYVTDALAAVLPNVRVESLPGQTHEGMTTAPRMYAEAVARFLLEPSARD